MSLVPFVLVILVGSPLAKAFVLQPEEPSVTKSSPVLRTSRCQAETLQSIRKIILDSLGLQTEPHVSVRGMDVIRDQWKVTFKGTSQSEPTNAENGTSFESSSPGNSTVLRCCKFASQIFTKDLGWDKWIVFPESFTFVQCSGCDPHVDQSSFPCGGYGPPSAQVPCCEPTARELVPLLYLDETSSFIMASVTLTRECGCGLRTPEP